MMRGLLILGLLATAPATLAERRDEPVSIRADHIELNERTGRALYRGNVRLRQGDISIRADRLEAWQRDGRTVRTLAAGQPARFRQAPATPDDETVEFSAGRIDYHVPNRIVHATGNATAARGQDRFQATTLRYEIGPRRLSAGGQGEGRVSATLYPRETKAAP
jgi:lipopolysaccharide export system protein LptA